MDCKLILKPEAEKDIRKAMAWYNEQNKNLPDILLNIIDESLEKIKEFPEHYQKRYNDIRIVFTKKFPYGIYYTLEENTIFVHAVLHTKQNPTTAEKRIK